MQDTYRVHTVISEAYNINITTASKLYTPQRYIVYLLLHQIPLDSRYTGLKMKSKALIGIILCKS